MSNTKKSKNFFVISNFNTDPSRYVDYCENYHIYDQSTNSEIINKLKEKSWKNISYVENTGHNISDYFNFFIDNYDNLPDVMLLGKGNMIGRHVSLEYFERVYNNQSFTFLYNDCNPTDAPHRAYHLFEGAYIELNNSWYANKRANKYFRSYNQLLSFIYENPIIPSWILFSPGACYIVTKQQVLKNPIDFYKNIFKLISYEYFPSESYMVERMMPVFFLGNYKIRAHMLNNQLFDQQLVLEANGFDCQSADCYEGTLERLAKKISRFKTRLVNVFRFTYIELFK